MEASTVPAARASGFTRLRSGYLRLDVRNIAKIKVEDMALAGGYFAVFWLLDAVHFTTFGDFRVMAFASAWPAIAVLGCTGVLLRRASPTAMAWMCGLAVIGLVLAGHAGAFVLAFEFFFSLVLFASPRASHLAARSAWVLTVMLALAAFTVFRTANETVAAAVIAVVTLLTPAEWAGNLRKANQLADSESARADAVHDASQQRLLAERSAHDLALERQRAHMARELHDVISARLSAIALQSGAALQPPTAHRPSDHPTSTPTEVLAQIRTESVAGLDELNGMIRLLHTGALDETAGHLADLASLVDQYRLAGTSISLENSLDDAGDHLPLPVQTAVYRITAEALVNATKHAPGEEIGIFLTSAAHPENPSTTPGPVDGIVLSVCNPLPDAAQGAHNSGPHDSRTSTGTGIPSMHFRAALAGGTMTAGPEEGQWKILLRIPLANPASPAFTEGGPA